MTFMGVRTVSIGNQVFVVPLINLTSMGFHTGSIEYQVFVVPSIQSGRTFTCYFSLMGTKAEPKS